MSFLDDLHAPIEHVPQLTGKVSRQSIRDPFLCQRLENDERGDNVGARRLDLLRQSLPSSRRHKTYSVQIHAGLEPERVSHRWLMGNLS